MLQVTEADSGRKQLRFKKKALGLYVRLVPLVCALAVPFSAQVQAEEATREQLLKRIAQLEKQMSRMDRLEQRLNELETTAVLSDPETYVSKVEIFVDDDGVEHATKQPGTHSVVTYQRERVYRRQTINEKIEDALSGEAASRVQVGVDAAITMQYATQDKGSDGEADGEFYQLASTDLYFTAELAKNTIFYADIVGLSGTTPGGEIGGLTDINGYSARLRENDDQLNDLSLREAWLMTELFDQQLALTVGRIDLTSFFDSNAVANDETSQFLSDALVNNPMLGLSENGAGMAAVYDPKNGVTLKLGYQQSDSTATNLSDALFQMAEVGYQFNPFGSGEGNYRAWYRTDNGEGNLSAYGFSVDQKVAAGITLFGRYGEAETVSDGDDEFFSGGVQFSDGLGFNPSDVWGLGFANTVLGNDDEETLFEGYYTLSLAERLALSFHLTYIEEEPDGADDFSYLVPGFRLQANY
jgi:hypothetical protein